MNYVTDVSSTWDSKMEKKSRWFNFYNSKLILSLVKTREYKFKLHNLEYRPWTSIQKHIPNYKDTPRMRNAMLCFSVMIGTRRRVHQVPTAKLSSYRFAGIGHRIKYKKTNDCMLKGFKIDEISPFCNPNSLAIREQYIVKYRVQLNGASLSLSYTGGDKIMMSDVFDASRLNRPHNDGIILGFGILTKFLDWEGIDKQSLLEAVNITYSDFGAQYTFTGGSYPQWLYDVFDEVGVAVRCVTRHKDNTHVVNHYLHGSYIKIHDWNIDDIEYSTILELSPQVDVFKNPFITLAANDDVTKNEFRRIVGPFDIL